MCLFPVLSLGNGNLSVGVGRSDQAFKAAGVCVRVRAIANGRCGRAAHGVAGKMFITDE